MTNNDHFEDSDAAARDIKDTLKEGAAQVGADVRQTADDARQAASDTADAARAAGPTLAEGVREKLENVREQAQDVVGDLCTDVVDGIRRQPVTAVAIAALGGAVLALLARRAMD